MGDVLQHSTQLSALAPHARAELAAACDRFALRQGETLFRQGMAADALYLVAGGRLEIAARIPGDTMAAVSVIGPGEVVGEFALLDDGPRSANVIALEDSNVLRLSRPRFLALLADGKPWTLDLIDLLRGLVAMRTRATLAQIAAAARYDLPSLRTPAAGGATGPGGDAAPLFPALGRLAALGDDGAALLAAAGTCLTVPRGTLLAEAGAVPGRLTLVLRGALRSVLPRPQGSEQVMVHGPGEMTGLVGLFDGAPQPLGLEAAETAVVLVLPRTVFKTQRRSPAPPALALFAAAGRQLVRDQRRANRHLGRAVSLAQFNRQGAA